MHRRHLLVKILLIVFLLLVSACSTQSTEDTSILPTSTSAPIQPAETSTLTSTPEPTSTPTIMPTPIGGKGGLLMYQTVCHQDSDCVSTIFLYNINSHELNSLIEGYFPLDVSPDGRNVLLKNTSETGDLFILDLTLPNQKTLLRENVDDAVWLGNSDWIGFISPVDLKGQVFLIKPDGSDLTQVTNSSIGAVTLASVFNDGVFWGEGTSNNINAMKWTKLDGSEKTLINFIRSSPSGKYYVTFSGKIGPACGFDCYDELTDTATSEKTEIKLVNPNLDIDFQNTAHTIIPLTDEKWLVEKFATSTGDRQYWLYSSDGTVLSGLPTDYDIAYGGDPPPSSILSPDRNWILVGSSEKISDEQFNVTYHLFNTTTAEIQDLPNLYYTSTGMKIVGNRRIDGDIEGCRINTYFWVEIP